METLKQRRACSISPTLCEQPPGEAATGQIFWEANYISFNLSYTVFIHNNNNNNNTINNHHHF